MKRFFLLLLAFTVSLTGLSVLLPVNDANAASSYDNVIQTATSLKLSQAGVTCDPAITNFDYVTRWSELLTENTIDNGFKISDDVTLPVSYDGNGTAKGTLDNIWKNDKKHWAVTQDTADGQKFFVTFTLNETDSLNFKSFSGYDDKALSVTPSSNTYQYTITISKSGSQCFLQTRLNKGSAFDVAYLSVSGATQTPLYRPLFVNWNINYPSGYEGIVPPDTAPTEGTVYTPEVGYSVTTDNVINGLFIGGSDVCLPVGLTVQTACLTPGLKWTILGPDKTQVLDEKYTAIGYPYSFKLPGNDRYYLQVEYTQPPVPAPPLAPGTKLVKVIFAVDANGTFQSGSTSLNTCELGSDSNECEAANPLEDCTTYGLDVGGYFQCIINNFGIWLRDTMINLFIPKYSFYTNWVDDFQTYLNEKLGFVYASFGLISGIFGGIITGAVTTKCMLAPPGTLFGGTFSVDVCAFQTIVGNTVFGIVQGLVIGLTILALAFAAYRKYLEVVDNR